VIGIALNLWITFPFISGLTWAFGFAVAARPVHRWMRSRVRRPGLAAGLAVLIVTLALVIPAIFLVWQIGSQAGNAATGMHRYLDSDEWERLAKRYPPVARVWKRVEANVNIKEQGHKVLDFAQKTVVSWMGSAVSGAIQVLIALFALFYFFRDQDLIVREMRSIMPLSERETDHLFKQLRDTTHATIYGTFVVSSVQGFLGGLMFWILGLPGPLIWGTAMGLLAIIPVAGAFIIWFPAAVFLASQGALIKALIMCIWGSCVVGLVDNLLYPILVGNELRLHTLPVFIAIVGGIVTFGASGMVLGPVIMAGTLAIFDILKRRTAHGRSAKQEVADKAA
jgi:predicted PurR-regulated permease PerM